MNQFIIATHSTLAEGFANVIRFFNAELTNVRFINGYVEHQEFEKEFREALNEVRHQNVIVLTDILGGSVNQTAVKLLPEYGYHLITGINLPLLLELVFMLDDITKDQIQEIICRAKEQLIYLETDTLEEKYLSADGNGDEL